MGTWRLTLLSQLLLLPHLKDTGAPSCCVWATKSRVDTMCSKASIQTLCVSVCVHVCVSVCVSVYACVHVCLCVISTYLCTDVYMHLEAREVVRCPVLTPSALCLNSLRQSLSPTMELDWQPASPSNPLVPMLQSTGVVGASSQTLLFM